MRELGLHKTTRTGEVSRLQGIMKLEMQSSRRVNRLKGLIELEGFSRFEVLHFISKT